MAAKEAQRHCFYKGKEFGVQRRPKGSRLRGWLPKLKIKHAQKPNKYLKEEMQHDLSRIRLLMAKNPSFL